MALQSYKKQNWIDHQVDEATSEIIVLGTPVDKIHLDHIESGIQTADSRAIEALNALAAVSTQLGEMTLDCGTFDGDTPVNTHNTSAAAHPNLIAYGGTLEEHMTDPLSHENIVLDGNAG